MEKLSVRALGVVIHRGFYKHISAIASVLNLYSHGVRLRASLLHAQMSIVYLSRPG